MKVLFFVDTHASSEKLHKLKDKARFADILVCGGDFTIFEHEMDSILNELDMMGKPVILIHGNHETASGVRESCQNFQNLHFIHDMHHIIGNLIFYGYGGGGFSTKDESFTESSEMFMQELKHLSEKNNKRYKLVLITHAPPYGTRLDEIGSYVGNKSIREFILKHQPTIAISGHIHETAGVEDKLNNTKLINPGPDGMIIEL